jgi:PadR family transcriptional regulator PadR
MGFWSSYLDGLLTRPGRRQLERETRNWEQTTAILQRFLTRAEGQA